MSKREFFTGFFVGGMAVNLLYIAAWMILGVA